MNILHWMKKENSGLARSTLEVCEEEERQGHTVCIRQPSEDNPIYGTMNGETDLHCVHSQLGVGTYADNLPKIMWMHGEPLSSVSNGVSMKAINDLASKVDAFICMRKDEHIIWQSVLRERTRTPEPVVRLCCDARGLEEVPQGEVASLQRDQSENAEHVQRATQTQ